MEQTLPKNAATTARRKRRGSEEIRELIVAAAGREFEENGFTGATTAAIARRAEVTEAQIFRFFPSKAALFHAAIFEPLNRHFSEFQSRHLAEVNEAEPVRALAHRYIGELQDFMEEHSGMLMSLIVANAYSPGAAKRIGEVEGLRDYFARGKAMMESRSGTESSVPPELMVRVSFAAVLASVMFRDWLFPAGMASEDEIRRAIAEFTIGGIRANDPTI